MRKITAFYTGRILAALCHSNTKPVQHLIETLRADERCCCLSDAEVQCMKAIECFLLGNGFIEQAQTLIRAAGYELLLKQPESTFKPAIALVENGEEYFVEEVFSALQRANALYALSESQSNLLFHVAEKALSLGKENIALYVYRVICARGIFHTHPLLIAAKKNRIMAQAYRDVYQRLKYNQYEHGGLEDLVVLDDCFYAQVALECGANVLAPTSTGESVLDLPISEKMRLLLLQHGAQPTDRKVYLLRQAILSIEKGSVDHAVLQEIFADPKPLLSFTFHERTHETPFKTQWNLIRVAARHKCIPAITYLAPYLRDAADDKLLLELLEGLFEEDPIRPVDRSAEKAQKILSVLEVLDTNHVRFKDPWDWDNDGYFMNFGHNSKVASILDSVSFTFVDEMSYSDEALIKMAALLWSIGGIAYTSEGGRELFQVGLNNRKMCLLEYCLSEFDVDFSILDTDRTATAWTVVVNHKDSFEDVAITKAYLQFVLENGADVNHQTDTGNTALHAAYQYSGFVGWTPRKLLLRAGANRFIRNNEGKHPWAVKKAECITLSKAPWI